MLVPEKPLQTCGLTVTPDKRLVSFMRPFSEEKIRDFLMSTYIDVDVLAIERIDHSSNHIKLCR